MIITHITTQLKSDKKQMPVDLVVFQNELFFLEELKQRYQIQMLLLVLLQEKMLGELFIILIIGMEHFKQQLGILVQRGRYTICL